MKKLIALICAAMLCGLLPGCGKAAPGGEKIRRKSYSSEELQFAAPQEGDLIAVLDTSLGQVRAVLYPQQAPQACENFIALAEEGFYTDTVIYRAENGFCVEGGLSSAGGSTTKWGGSGYPAEVTDSLHHYTGALCAAMDANGMGGSVFYVLQTLPDSVDDALAARMAEAGYREAVQQAYRAVGGAPYLDYTDTVFGQVFEGMEVVDAIAGVAVEENFAPVEPVVIRSVTVETYRK